MKEKRNIKKHIISMLLVVAILSSMSISASAATKVSWTKKYAAATSFSLAASSNASGGGLTEVRISNIYKSDGSNSWFYKKVKCKIANQSGDWSSGEYTLTKERACQILTNPRDTKASVYIKGNDGTNACQTSGWATTF